MTMEELKAALKADQEKAKAFEEALAGMTPETAGSDAEAVSLAAAAAGFEITPEEVERCAASDMEADDAELENVAGGGWWGSDDSEGNEKSCSLVWHCYYTFLHTSGGDSDTSCWSDYQCGGDFHKSFCTSTHVSYCHWAWETKD